MIDIVSVFVHVASGFVRTTAATMEEPWKLKDKENGGFWVKISMIAIKFGPKVNMRRTL